MADLVAFYDMTAVGGTVTTLRYDLSAYVGGTPGDENPVLGGPARMTTRAESFLNAGAYMAPEFHDSTRPIRIPIAIRSATWDAAATIWEAIAAQLNDFPLALRMQLSGSSNTVNFEVLPSSTWELSYATWDQRTAWIRGALLLECQPYPIGASAPKTFVS